MDGMDYRFFRLPFSERYDSFSLYKQGAKMCASENKWVGMRRQLGQRKGKLRGIKIGQKQKLKIKRKEICVEYQINT